MKTHEEYLRRFNLEKKAELTKGLEAVLPRNFARMAEKIKAEIERRDLECLYQKWAVNYSVEYFLERGFPCRCLHLYEWMASDLSDEEREPSCATGRKCDRLCPDYKEMSEEEEIRLTEKMGDKFLGEEEG